MQIPAKPHKASPILTVLLLVVIGAVLFTISAYLPEGADAREESIEEDLMRQKLVGRWEQALKTGYLDMELTLDGNCTYGTRNSDRVNIRGTWTLEQGRLILHITSVNAGSTFQVGEDVTLGPILNVDSRTLVLGTEGNRTSFRRQR